MAQFWTILFCGARTLIYISTTATPHHCSTSDDWLSVRGGKPIQYLGTILDDNLNFDTNTEKGKKVIRDCSF